MPLPKSAAPTRPMRRTTTFALRPLASVLALVGTANASAQGAQPYYIGLSETISHDSNIFRTNNGNGSGSTTASSTALVGGVDQPLGRQQLHADAFVAENRYLSHSDLNNTSYGVDALLKWSTVARISGTLGAAVTRGLADYATTTLVAQQPLRSRNLSTAQTYSATVDKGMAARWSVDASLAHRAVSYSAQEFSSATFHETSATLGINYHPSDRWSLGPSIGYSRGEYPDYVSPSGVSGSTYTRHDYNLNSTYRVSGFTGLNARIGYTQQTNSLAPQQDFSGVTGSLGFNYSPGGRTSYSGSIWRDTGSNFYPVSTGIVASLPSPGIASPPIVTPVASAPGLNGIYSNNSLTTVSEQLQMNYAATAKVSLGLGVSHSNHQLRDPNGGNGSDSGNSLFASASYLAKRYLTLGCGAAYSTRSSSSALSSSYSDRVVSCTAQLTLR